ncbi:hypothetical protein RhiXN_06654 [Rhizoctonia solani]|uniref:Uncharacterized protein n=1 Tax=Rhizoctonia solani TaxID=456999 RepID=A0A8H8NYE1_9AGAM|nr:uncharacterized protein RhiXN_06654 [Rhizoctonia solani]QRW21665.1 hypothetical protein RhiXN_06654 [Rhizoctonia solani]
MSEEHVQFPLVIQQRKTESISTFPNGSGDHPPLAPNGVNIQTPTGSQTPTSTEINGLEDRPIINGTAAALVIDGENGIVISAPAPAGPPPPYSEEPRRSRRPTLVSAHSDDDEDDEDDGDRDDAEEEHRFSTIARDDARGLHLLGTTLLITLPFGVVFWFLTLFLSRSFARAELHLQSKFHRPLRVAPADPPRPIFYRSRPPEDIERALTEPGTEVDVDPTTETSFLKNSYSMFTDPSSFQPLFYFLVIKASITLVVTPLVLALAPVCIILVLPAPAMLRIVRRIGAWQANLAIEALS